MKMLCPKKFDQWKCTGGYDKAFKRLVLPSLATTKKTSK
jgi:hypothetical protein